MAKKVTVVLPDNICEEIYKLGKELDCTTLSSVVAVAIKILDWTVSKINDGYNVKAIQEIESRVKSLDCPLVYFKKITEDKA